MASIQLSTQQKPVSNQLKHQLHLSYLLWSSYNERLWYSCTTATSYGSATYTTDTNFDPAKKFADNTKIGQKMLTTQDKEVIHLALEDLYDWPVKRKMESKVWKCQVMHLGNNNPPNIYEMWGQVLAATTEEKDIRVTVTSNLKPSAQCAVKTKKTVLCQGFPLFH